MAEFGITLKHDWETLLQETNRFLLKLWEEDLKESEDTTNLHKPLRFSPKPIILLVLKSWIIQQSVDKLTKQDKDVHILETEMRLRLKLGQYKTLVR